MLLFVKHHLMFSRMVFYFLGFFSESQILNYVSKEFLKLFLASLNESSYMCFLLAKFFFISGLQIRSIIWFQFDSLVMLILYLHLGNTKMKCALAVLIRMEWNGLFKMVDLVVEPKNNLGQVQSNFVILLLVSVLFLFVSKASQ